jgi:rhamnosyltransferase
MRTNLSNLQTSSLAAKDKKICAVMVTYNPDSTLEQNILALLPEVEKLIVVDNGSDLASRSYLQGIASTCELEVIWNGENLGLAAALNAGIERALAEDRYTWVATFDHDSRALPGFRKTMLAAYQSCPFRDEVALISPHYMLFPKESFERPEQPELTPQWREKTATLQSGILIRSDVFRSVGMFDASFFIDYVDFEFCLRLRKHGFRIIEASNAKLVHRVGNPTTHTIFYKTYLVFNHAPFRRYYITRNRLRIYRRYLFAYPRWIGQDAWSWVKELVKLALFEKNRGAKLRCIARGAWDALRGRSGPYTHAIPRQENLK